MLVYFITAFIAIVLLLIAAVFLRPNLILSSEFVISKIKTPHSHFIKWKNNSIHYTDEGEGEVILMIHGLGGSFYNFQGMTEILKSQYRIIRVDVPGMGLSEFKGVNSSTDFFTDYSDFFQFFVEKLDIKSMHVMGNSLGGMLSWMITSEIPEKVKSLVLLNSAGYDIDKVLVHAAGPVRWKWFGHILDKGLPRFITDYCLIRPFYDKSKVDPKELDYVYLLLNKEGNIHTLASLATSNQRPDIEQILHSINTPTLIIWGENDIIIPVEHANRFEKDIQNSQKIIYQNCGHMSMMEYPESVVHDFKQFWEENENALKA